MVTFPPFTAPPPFLQSTTLDGTPYVFDFRFNFRENTWSFSIFQSDGTTRLASGIKVVSNYPLLQKYASPLVPQGEIFCLSQTSDDSPPGLLDLQAGGRCILAYLSKSDLPANFEPWRL